MLILDRAEKNENGFTLIETAIALIILAIALLGIAQMQISAMQGNRSSYDITEASALASDIIEQLVIQSWNPSVTVTCLSSDIVVLSNISYTRQCNPPTAGGQIGQRLFRVTVTWYDQNRNRSLTASSLL